MSECGMLPSLTNLKISSNGKCFFLDQKTADMTIIDCLPHTRGYISEDAPGKTSSTSLDCFCPLSTSFKYIGLQPCLDAHYMVHML